MKKAIIIAVAILVFIIALLFIFNSLMRRGSPAVNEASITPTSVPFETFDRVGIMSAARSLAPYESETFRYDYSPTLDKMTVQEKTTQGGDEFNQWIVDQGLTELVGNPELVVFDDQLSTGSTTNSSSSNGSFSKGGKKPESDPLDELFRSLFEIGLGLTTSASGEPIVTPTPQSNNLTPPPQSNNPPSSGNPQSGSKTYYAQCNGYGDLALPSGCTLCRSGCGPTTVAMIAASYLGSQYNPKTIVDLYKNKGFFLGCGGSYYADAKAAIESLGLKTTSYMSYNLGTADRVASDFKKYIDAGWTIFTLANFRPDGGGHFFWVTEVRGNNIYAYDPFYGKSSTPPIDENSRYPFPKYRLAFGVKK